jgi:hypothetical protein
MERVTLLDLIIAWDPRQHGKIPLDIAFRIDRLAGAGSGNESTP